MIVRMNRIMGRANAIDSLRGGAALAVVLLHAKGMLWVGTSATWAKYGLGFEPNAWLGYLSFPILFGYLGVYLFFVLSGYCIHYRGAHDLAANTDKQLDVKTFALRRFVRIYPVYFAALCVTVLVDSLVISNGLVQLDDNQDRTLFTFLANLLSLQGLFAPTFGSNGVLWTLSLEMHLYAVYPILYYLSRKFDAKRTLIFTLLVSLGYIFIDDLVGIRQRLPAPYGIGPVFLSYWFTWTLGFYLAEVNAGRSSLPAGFYRISLLSALTAIVLVLLGKFTYIHMVDTFFYDSVTTICTAVAFGGLVSWSTTRRGKEFLDGILGRFLAKVGVFSYSLYAIHAPVLLLFKSAIVALGISMETLAPTALGVMVSLVAGLLCFFAVEQWSLKSPVHESGAGMR